MARPGAAEGNGFPKDVIICRFGSAYSTLTVYLCDKKWYDSNQEELNKHGAAEHLKEPALKLGERVCFRDFKGNWVLARIRTVHDDGAENDPKVDIVLETTREIYTRVEAKTLRAVPPPCKLQGHALPYFIKGLEPYRAKITQKKPTRAVTAQCCADALNEILDSESRVARLEELINPNLADIRAARFDRIFVASLTVLGNMDIPTFIESYLTDYVVTRSSDRRVYFDSVWHPHIIPHDGCSVLVPHVSEAGETCEVISLRKNSDGSLRVGLRLMRYLDHEPLFKRLLGGPARLSGDEQIGPLTFVCINSQNSCVQRGVVLNSGKVLGIDTLDIFDPKEEDVRVCLMTHSLGDALPHLALFIDWRTSGPTPSIGDFVVVKQLRPHVEHNELLQYLYEDVKILDEPTVIGGRDLRVCNKKPRMAEPSEQPMKMFRMGTRSRASLVEWYGLRPDLAPFFSEIHEDHASLYGNIGVLFSKFAVAVPLNVL